MGAAYDNKVTAQGSCHVMVKNETYIEIWRTVHQMEKLFYCMIIFKIKKLIINCTTSHTHIHKDAHHST